MVVFTIPMKYIQEQFLKLGITLIIELFLILSKSKDAATWSFFGVSVSIYIGSQFVLIVFTILSFLKIKCLSFLDVLRNGINKLHLLKQTLYFIHFYTIRLTVILLFSLSSLAPSYILYIILLAIQLISFLLHFIKFYNEWEHYVLSIFREMQILYVVCYLMILHFVND